MKRSGRLPLAVALLGAAIFVLGGCSTSRDETAVTASETKANSENVHTILLTDDDGWDAPGIRQMYRSLTAAGYDVTLVGPKDNYSGASMSAKGGELEAHRSRNNPDFWWVDGTPVDAVRVGLTGISSQTPDLVISGANNGANAAYNVNYSGTIGAATAAAEQGVPAIAVSADVDSDGDASMKAAARRTVLLVKSLTAGALREMRHGILVNVNVPVPGSTGRFRVTTQGRTEWTDIRYTKASGGTWAPSYSATTSGGSDSDKKWLAAGRTTLTVLTTSRDDRKVPSADVRRVLVALERD